MKRIYGKQNSNKKAKKKQQIKKVSPQIKFKEKTKNPIKF